MYRDEVGYIDFVYGKEGTIKKDRSDGYGLAKILKKHGRGTVDKIPEVIANKAGTDKILQYVSYRFPS